MSDDPRLVLADQLKAATSRAHRYRQRLLKIAARAEDYSAQDIRAQVADALEITVRQLKMLLEEE